MTIEYLDTNNGIRLRRSDWYPDEFTVVTMAQFEALKRALSDIGWLPLLVDLEYS